MSAERSADLTADLVADRAAGSDDGEGVAPDPNDIRDPRPVRRHAPVILAAVLALAVELVLAVQLWRGALDIWMALAGHGALILLLLGATAAYWRMAGGALPALALLLLATFLLGPLGPIGCLFTIAFYLATERNAPQFSDWYESIFPENDDDAAEMSTRLMERVGRDGGSISPFLDVLSFGTRAQKQMAVAVMTRHFHPAFAPALRQALDDTDNAVRVQAATAMATIEDRFVERAEELRAEMERHPKDNALVLRLARHFDDYAYTGLLDAQRQAESQTQALDSYMRYLDRNPEDADARLAVGRLLLRIGETEGAVQWFERCFEANIWSSTMVAWHMDALYRLGRFDAVRVFARRHRDELTRLDTYPVQLIEMVRLWSGDTQEEEAAHAD